MKRFFFGKAEKGIAVMLFAAIMMLLIFIFGYFNRHNQIKEHDKKNTIDSVGVITTYYAKSATRTVDAQFKIIR